MSNLKSNLESYRNLEHSLLELRIQEDNVLDEMDLVWQSLTSVEQLLLKAEPSKCWPESRLNSEAELVEEFGQRFGIDARDEVKAVMKLVSDLAQNRNLTTW